MSLLPEGKYPNFIGLNIIGQILRNMSPYTYIFIQGFVYMHPKSA